MAWLSDWKKRLKLTIDHTKIDEDLSNFPVMLNLNNYNAGVLFDELGWSSVDDNFTAASGSAPNSILWNEVDSHDVMHIQSNTLYYNSTSSENWGASTQSHYDLSGDFDLQVDFDITTITAPSSSTSYGAVIQLLFGSAWVFLPKGKGSDGVLKFDPNSSAGGSSSVADSDMSGRLRITRVGTVIKLYYWKNSQWEWNGSTAGLTSPLSTSDDVTQVRLVFNQDFDSTLTSSMDTFRLNSGNVICPTRKKIAVTTTDGVTQCYVEIEEFDSINKVANLWTKVPTITSGIDTVVYLYCDSDKADNTTYVGDITSTPGKNVWDDNFVGVWHMNQDPTGGSDCIKDSTVSGNHGTPGGSMVSGDLVDGKIGKALDFDGNDECVGFGDIFDPEASGFCAEIITKPKSIWSSFFYLLSKGNRYSTSEGWSVSADSSTCVVRCNASNDTAQRASQTKSGGFSQNMSTYLALVLDKTTNKILGYQDGTNSNWSNGGAGPSDNVITGFNINTSDEARVSCTNYNGSDYTYVDQVADEVRISNTARSPAWIKATYYSNWDDLITYESYYQAYEYYFTGYVFEDSEPVSRIVRAYISSTGWLAGEVTSSGTTGYYQLHVSTSGSHYLVCMDADELPDYNNLIIARAVPYSV